MLTGRKGHVKVYSWIGKSMECFCKEYLYKTWRTIFVFANHVIFFIKLYKMSVIYHMRVGVVTGVCIRNLPILYAMAAMHI